MQHASQPFHTFQGVSRPSRVHQIRLCPLVQETARKPAPLPDMDGGSRRRGDPGASNSDAFPNVYALVVYDNDAFRLCMYLVLMTLSLLATLMLIMMWKCNDCTPAARKEPRGFRSSGNYVPICAQCHGANLRQTTADADSARRQPGRITISPHGERWHSDAGCAGLRNAHSTSERTPCKICVVTESPP